MATALHSLHAPSLMSPMHVWDLFAEPGGAEHERGLFVCGWLKRGPTGIIGTNLADAEETVASLVATASELPAPSPSVAGPAALRAVLAQKGVAYVDWAGWERIDAEELRRGAALGKSREKAAAMDEMVRLAAGGCT